MSAESLPEPFSHREHGDTKRVKNGRSQSAAERRQDVGDIVGAWAAENPEANTPFGKENLARAYAFPSVGLIYKPAVDAETGEDYSFEQMWIDRFTRDPDLMWLLVGDIVRYVSSEETPRGQRQSSRRKVQGEHRNLESVWKVLHGHYSNDPFPVAIRELIGQRSERAFAMKCGFASHETLRRYIQGKRPLSMEALEQMAKGGKVEPHFFIEYRAMWLGRELMNAMMARPNESLRAVKQVKNAVV